VLHQYSKNKEYTCDKQENGENHHDRGHRVFNPNPQNEDLILPFLVKNCVCIRQTILSYGYYNTYFVKMQEENEKRTKIS
jgi:hypothetical protein